MRFSSKLSLATVALFALTSAASAQIGTYNFAGKPGDQVSEPIATFTAGATFTDIVRGTGLTPSAAQNSISSTGFSTGAIDLNDYYGFSVAPDAGFTLTLTGLDFSERRSGTAIRDIAIRSSRDGFTANIFTTNVPDDTLTRRQTVALGANFANLTSGVEFRIYGFTAEAAGGTWRLGAPTSAADNPNLLPANFLVNGTVTRTGGGTVNGPEPATLALFAPAFLAAGAILRRRKG